MAGLKFRILAAILGCMAFAASAVPAAAEDILILAGRLILPNTGEVRTGAQILVRDGHIIEVGSAIAAPQARRVDLSAYSVLPGLIDAHTHLAVMPDFKDITDELRRSPAIAAFDSIGQAREKLMTGFTTVREAGTYWAFVDVALRDAIDKGEVPGPRIVAAGAFLTMPGGGGALTGIGPDIMLPEALRYGVASGPDQVRERVRLLASHGANVIKTFGSGAVIQHGNSVDATEFTAAELSAAVDEARSLGMKVMAHAHAAAGIKTAIRAGVASIEHGTQLDDEAIALMKARGTYLVPTLSVWDCSGRGEPGGIVDSPEFGPRARNLIAGHRLGFTKALRAGVKIALGSDSAICGAGKGYRELQEMVKYGMTPMQALRAATSAAADLLGWPDVGAIAPGKFADIIAVEGDPTQKIDVMAQVRFVMKGGVIYKQ